MTTSIDVLAYIRSNYPTMGRLQRQKLLYYTQAWHAVWHGDAMFADPVQAWPMGPVAPDAWRCDRAWDSNPSGTTVHVNALSQVERATVDSIMAFYGHLTGADLKDLTHEESPWKDAYENVSPIMRGQVEIRTTSMRIYYSVLAIEGKPHPVRPIMPVSEFADDDLDSVIDSELDRWDGLLRILADR